MPVMCDQLLTEQSVLLTHMAIFRYQKPSRSDRELRV